MCNLETHVRRLFITLFLCSVSVRYKRILDFCNFLILSSNYLYDFISVFDILLINNSWVRQGYLLLRR